MASSAVAYSVIHWWAPAVALAAGASWALAKFVASIRRDRLVADTPLVRIRSAAQGYVKVRGRAKPAADGPTAAPLSSRPCVWWSYEVEEKRRGSRGGSQWCSIDKRSSVEPFVLADADAECLVGPINAEITATTQDVWYGEDDRPPGPPPPGRWFRGSGNYRYTERLLSVGDELSVVGQLRSSSEVASAETAAAALLHQWKQDQPALLARFDSNHDGRIDASEWEDARRAAAAEAQAGMLKTSVSRISVIGEPVNGEPFLIAAMDPVHLVQREKLRAAAFFGLGLICAVLCAWVIEHPIAVAALINTYVVN